MKIEVAIACMTLAGISSPSVFAADDHAGHGANHVAAPAAAMTDGLVKKVDAAGGKVTLAHGPLANLGMPAMTMVFRVKDKTWLDQMKGGDKIRFIADNVNGALTVVKLDHAE